jgi:hypothetical protein
LLLLTGFGDDGIDLAHGQLIEALAFGFGPNLLQPLGRLLAQLLEKLSARGGAFRNAINYALRV